MERFFFFTLLMFSFATVSNAKDFNLRKGRTAYSRVFISAKDIDQIAKKEFFRSLPDIYKGIDLFNFKVKKYVSSNITDGLFLKLEKTRPWFNHFYLSSEYEAWHPDVDSAIASYKPEVLSFIFSGIRQVKNPEYFKHYGFAVANNKKNCAKFYIENLLSDVYFYDAEIFEFNVDNGTFKAFIHRDEREVGIRVNGDGASYIGGIALDYHEVTISPENKYYSKDVTFCTISCYADYIDDKFKFSDEVKFIIDADKTCIEIYKENTEAVRLVTRVHNIIDARNSDGLTKLHFAAKECNIEQINLAFDRNAPVDITDIKGNTPILYAAYKGCIEGVKLLIETGKADPCQFSYSDLKYFKTKFTDIADYLKQAQIKASCY